MPPSIASRRSAKIFSKIGNDLRAQEQDSRMNATAPTMISDGVRQERVRFVLLAASTAASVQHVRASRLGQVD